MICATLVNTHRFGKYFTPRQRSMPYLQLLPVPLFWPLPRL